MKRRTTDISTNFSIEGLSAAQREIASFTRQVGASMRRLNATQVGIDIAGMGKSALDKLQRDEAAYRAWHDRQVERTVQAEVDATARGVAEATAARVEAENEYRAQHKARLAERIAVETAAAEDVAEATRAITIQEEFRLDEFLAAQNSHRLALEEGLQHDSLQRIIAIRKNSEDAFQQWKRQHASSYIDGEVAAAKRKADAEVAAKKSADQSYVTWWTGELDRMEAQEKAAAAEVARETADADRRVAEETAKVRRQSDEDYTSWWEDQLDARADEERRIVQETSDARQAADEDYQDWWKRQLDERADEEKRVAEETARVKKSAEEDYARWWAGALDQQEAAQKAMVDRGTRQMEGLKGIFAGFSFEGIGNAFDGIVEKAKNLADGLGAAAGVVQGMIGGVAGVVVGFGRLSAAAVRAGQRVVGAVGQIVVQVGNATIAVGRLTTRFALMSSTAIAAGAAASAAFVKMSVENSQKFIQTQEQVANTLGITIEEFSEFAGMAAYSSLSLEDLRQAMSQFLGVAGEAALGGNEYAKRFERLGVAVKDASGNVRSFSDILRDYATAQSKLVGAERTALNNQIFGDDDGSKVGRLLDRMATSTGKIATNVQNARGGLINLSGPGMINANEFDDSVLDSTWKAKAGEVKRAWELMRDINRETNDARRDQLFAELDAIDQTSRTKAEEYAAEFKRYETIAKLRRSGVLLTGQDLVLSTRYKNAITELSQTFQGLRLAIFRAFGPTMITWIRMFTGMLQANRNLIVGGLINAYNTVIKLVRDVAKVIFGSDWGYKVENTWLYDVKKFADEAEKVLREMGGIGYEIARIFVQVARELDGLIKFQSGKTSLEWLKSVNADVIVDRIRYAKLVVQDFFNVLSGKDYNLTTSFGRTMRDWRDTLYAWAEDAKVVALNLVAFVIEQVQTMPGRFAEGFAAILPFLQDIGNTILDVINGIITADMSQTKTTWGELGVLIRYAAAFAFEFARAIFDMTVLGQKASGSFAWLNWVVQAFEFLRAKVSQVIEILKPFYNFFNAITQVFGGLQFGTLLLILSFLKLSGIMTLLIKTGAMLMGLFGIQAAVSAGAAAAGAAFTGAVAAGGGFSAAMSLPAAFALMKTSIAAMIPVIWAAMAPFAKWLLIIGALIIAFQVIPKAIAGALDWLSGALGFGTNEGRIQEAFDATKAAGDKLYEERVADARRRGLTSPDEQRANMIKAQQEAASRSTGYGGIDSVLSQMGQWGSQMGNGMTPVNLNVNGNELGNLWGEVDQLENITRSEFVSIGGQ